jgi:prepilin-type N-terminal cleavage/methylation domain-containing protein
MIRRTLGQNGFSFIEILSSVSVFAVVAVGLSPALLSARKVAAVSRSQSMAMTLAGDKIEQMRAQSGLVTAGSDGPLQADGSSGGIFNRAWTVFPADPTIGLSRVVVTVSWRERDATNAVSLSAVIPQ